MNGRNRNASLANESSYAGVDFTPEAGRDVKVSSLWRAFERRRALFLIVFSVFVAAVAIVKALQPHAYATQVKLIVGGSNADGSAQNASLVGAGVRALETYTDLIQQLPVARQVVDELHLATTPAVLLSSVRAKPVPDTAILGITATWADPETSARIANGFAAVFVRRQYDIVTHRAEGAIKSLESELPRARARLLLAQSALSAYQRQSNLFDVPMQTTNLIASQAGLDAQGQQAELEGREAAASLQMVKAELVQAPRTLVGQKNIVPNPAMAQLQSQVATLQGQLNAARAQYTEDYPAVSALKAQLLAAQLSLRALPPQILGGTQTVPNPLYEQLSQRAVQLHAALAASRAQLATIARQQRDGRPAIDRLPESTRRITELQHNAKAEQDIYDVLQRKYQEANLQKLTAVGDVTIAQPADARNAVQTRNSALDMLFGIVVGLALALAAVFLAEYFDDRFRTEEDIKIRLGLPVLATIPSFGARDTKDRAWMKPLSVEAFYQLVASLRYSSETPPRTIAFTSPDQGDGKSTVAVNTALSMGLMKARVLVVDADLRRPTIHEKFNIANERGVTDVLVGLALFADVIKPTEHEGVSVITSGRSAPNPVALLQSVAFDRLLKSATERYDYVVIDGPALRSIVDGVVLGNKTDGTVLVISAQKSEPRAVQSALAKLRGVGAINVLGVVLNAVRPDARDRNDYYLGGGPSIALSATRGG